MNKRKVEEYLPRALEGLANPKCNIRKKDKNDKFLNQIEKNFRGQISSFGAAVTMGSFKAAVAFFGQKGSAEVDRSELLRLINYVVNNDWETADKIVTNILGLADSDVPGVQEQYLNASVAIKLAMNAFELV